MARWLWALAACLVASCHHDPPPRAAPAPSKEPTVTNDAVHDDPHVVALGGFRDRACACKDKPCVDQVQKDLIAYAYADTSDDHPGAEVGKAADAIMKQFEACVRAAGGQL